MRFSCFNCLGNRDLIIKLRNADQRVFPGLPWEYEGVAFRRDDAKSKNTTSRTLRSGRAVDMVKYRGLIYEKMFRKLRHVELRVGT
jgi:hypothetical protein